jgi:hypothetical protein
LCRDYLRLYLVSIADCDDLLLLCSLWDDLSFGGNRFYVKLSDFANDLQVIFMVDVQVVMDELELSLSTHISPLDDVLSEFEAVLFPVFVCLHQHFLRPFQLQMDGLQLQGKAQDHFVADVGNNPPIGFLSNNKYQAVFILHDHSAYHHSYTGILTPLRRCMRWQTYVTAISIVEPEWVKRYLETSTNLGK